MNSICEPRSTRNVCELTIKSGPWCWLSIPMACTFINCCPTSIHPGRFMRRDRHALGFVRLQAPPYSPKQRLHETHGQPQNQLASLSAIARPYMCTNFRSVPVAWEPA